MLNKFKSLPLYSKFLVVPFTSFILLCIFLIYFSINSAKLKSELIYNNTYLIPIYNATSKAEVILEKTTNLMQSAVNAKEIEWLRETNQYKIAFEDLFDNFMDGKYTSHIKNLQLAFSIYYDTSYSLSKNLIEESGSIHSQTKSVIKNYNILYNQLEELKHLVAADLLKQQQKQNENTNNVILVTVIVLIIIMLISLVVGSITYNTIKNNITTITSEAKRIASSDISFNDRINLEKFDEIGEVAYSINTFIDKLENNQKELLQTNKELETLKESLEETVDIKTKELFKSQEKILEQSKMSAMGEMIANIAHQWRQPLTAISILSTGSIVAKESNNLTDKIFYTNMESINDNAQYLSKIIDVFRDFLRGTSEKEEININELLDEGLALVRDSLAQKHIKIINNQNNNFETQKIYIAKHEFSQVIINILNNAKDIFIEREIDFPKVIVDYTIQNQKLIITIKDNAGGLPYDILGRIFEPYFTTKHKSQGTGLGLHMSYRIVKESLDGNIYASNTDTGAMFTIELPLENTY